MSEDEIDQIIGQIEKEWHSNGYLHLCGKTYWKRHCEVMMAIYELAEKTIKKYDADTAA